MSERDGGINVTAEQYYDKLGTSYWNSNCQVDSYHQMRMSAFLHLVDSYLNKSFDVFNFGCGTGETIEPLIHRGFKVSGCDISKTMVESAKLIKGVGNIEKGGVEILKQKNQLDNVIALNVLPYLTAEEENDFWASCGRLMRTGSVVIGSHTNMLFDLFTFNRYTLEFYEKNLLSIFPREHRQHLLKELSSLITFPNLPERSSQVWHGASNVPAASERDKIQKRRVCPFEYPHKIESYGFRLNQLKPVNVFPLPPLVIEKSSELVFLQHKAQDIIENNVFARLFSSQFQFAFTKV